MADHNLKLLADSHYYVPEALQTQIGTMAGNASALVGAGGFGSGMVRKSVAFDGTANKGALGAVPLFTVTGAVVFRITAICTESLASGAGSTLSIGTAAATAGIIAVTTAVDIDAGDIWFAAAPATVLDTLANSMLAFVIGDEADIKGTVAVDTITDGTIEFTVFWTALTATGNVIAA